ncbi:uncharacterized protein LOC111706897 [Eurytemora carolleeae]|uniref:uncharacterized protein LOC111706897 n=1 Tax=Eurytemora carolleeae TaxID=1294199 RepID=UPI000C765A49|nr:uncharacterized protein LOC111706897 [Eurytemora carolleeae]|eukprot:XP_023335615.1 uncharacterized protein LOC111706897 [Eurytemora affinis]
MMVGRVLLLVLYSLEVSAQMGSSEERRGKKVLRKIKKVPHLEPEDELRSVSRQGLGYPGGEVRPVGPGEDAPRLFDYPKTVNNRTYESSNRFINPLSIFSVVQFPNTECPTDTGVAGTCYTQYECDRRQGQSKGSCAGGFGVCCLFNTPCNSETSENGTYFSSPAAISSVCSIMIRPRDEDICQVRLDLEELVLMDPDESGNCRIDYLQLSGGISNSGQMPTICGTNSGQHLIYTAIPSFPARLSIVVDNQVAISGGAGLTRRWRIKISQFSCFSPALAPEGCLQYYTGISGNVSSFNWKLTDNSMGVTSTVSNQGNTLSNHMANLDYSVCIRRESGYCSIEWSTPSPYSTQNGYFSLTGTEQTGILSQTDVRVGDTDCRTDYVLIPEGWGGTDLNNRLYSRDRYCGQALGYCNQLSCTTKVLGAVRSYTTPFTLGVVTDNSESLSQGGTGANAVVTDTKNRGFKLNFRQNPCN